MGIFFKTYGILGQNARNLDYIMGYNDEIAKNLADSKLKTKDFLKIRGIPVADTLLTLKNHKEIDNLNFDKLEIPFVIKPNSGYGGKGIIIIDKKDLNGNYVSNSGKIYSKEKLKKHFYDIIDGFFSLSGFRDILIIERKIILDHDIDLLGKFGLPDIRILVFNMVPIMAMLRVPTKNSDGKANLHAGACGVGIDIGSGKLTYITKHSRIIKSIPDIGDIRGIKIPKWNDLLSIAVKIQQVTGIGYLGCDLVLDENFGPILLEINVRAGLEVQVANMAPLKYRLKKVEGVNINSVEKGVRLGRDLFSGDIEEKIKNISGKKVLGTREYISIYLNEKRYKYIGDIVISSKENFLSKEFAKNILKIYSDEKKIDFINLKIKILGEEKYIKFNICELDGTKIILGINSLKGFLVDPYKYRKGEIPVSDDIEAINSKNIAINKTYNELLSKIDKKLISIDKKLIVLKYFTPKNIKKEKRKFIESKGEYIPKFEYINCKLNFLKLRQEVNLIEIPEIPLKEIYNSKKVEIINKINLFEAFSKKDYKNITYYSKKIYGEINKDNLEYSLKILNNKKKIKEEDVVLNFDEIYKLINKFNHIYDIKIKLINGNKSARFVMKGSDLIIKNTSNLGKREMRAVIAHEIEGHYLRKYNGEKIPYSIFSHGTANYLEIDEGVAIYNQNRFLNETDKKYYTIFEKYYFINYALNHNYKNLVSKLLDYYDNNLSKTFNAIMRLKRGFIDVSSDGVFCKDLVYVNGITKVEKYLSNGGELSDLYIGKITIDDLKIIKDSYFLNLKFSDIKTPFFL